jgi:predicted ABC-type exoprotein transport system permease subunit
METNKIIKYFKVGFFSGIYFGCLVILFYMLFIERIMPIIISIPFYILVVLILGTTEYYVLTEEKLERELKIFPAKHVWDYPTMRYFRYLVWGVILLGAILIIIDAFVLKWDSLVENFIYFTDFLRK